MNRNDNFDIRRGQPADAADIARLFLISSDGLAAYIWAQHAQNGEPVEVAPRTILARQVERARQQGFTVKVGSELEFFLLADDLEAAEGRDLGGRRRGRQSKTAGGWGVGKACCCLEGETRRGVYRTRGIQRSSEPGGGSPGEQEWADR